MNTLLIWVCNRTWFCWSTIENLGVIPSLWFLILLRQPLDHSNIYEIRKENKNRQPFLIYLCTMYNNNEKCSELQPKRLFQYFPYIFSAQLFACRLWYQMAFTSQRKKNFIWLMAYKAQTDYYTIKNQEIRLEQGNQVSVICPIVLDQYIYSVFAMDYYRIFLSYFKLKIS